jgi:hypothetical protein
MAAKAAMEFYGVPLIGQKQKPPMNGAQFDLLRVGNTGEGLIRNRNVSSMGQRIILICSAS